jgi:type IV pilus assembly protein PilY1
MAMNIRTFLFSGSSGTPLKTWSVRIATLAVLSAVTVGVVISQTVTLPPLVDLPSEPLYMNGAKTKANLTLALSVEFPTVGQTYRDTFDITKEYVGYFDPKACYTHNTGQNSFDWTGAPNSSGSCGGGGFSGNFMNWATSSAIDILRYGLTGGNRIVDESSGNAKTVLQRAWLPDSFYRSGSYFSEKSITKAQAADLVETSLYNKIPNGGTLWIYNCRNRVYFAKSQDTDSDSTCARPFDVANAGSSQLIGSTNNQTYYELNMLVCDPNSATNRLMTYDPDTKKWSGLCYRYPNGKYKPVGQFQMNAENLRVSVFGYLQDNSRSRYGGVLRAPL